MLASSRLKTVSPCFTGLYISKLEAGQKNPTVSTMQQLATSLGVELKALFDSAK
ncbi:MAG: helix-turn-helix transcriptional regulator [Pseudomonadota bacterium]